MTKPDLNFRPDYTSPLDALSAILVNIKGQRRRQLIADVTSGRARESLLALTGDEALANLLAEVDPDLLAEGLEDPGRLGALGPTFLGGEFLPGYRKGEVEIGRIVMDSTTMDVISIRARRDARGYRFRAVDEYETPFKIKPKTAVRPLTLGQMVELICRLESEDSAPGPTGETTAIFGKLDWDLGEGTSIEEAAEFFTIESEFYPDLGALVDQRISSWLESHSSSESEDGS